MKRILHWIKWASPWAVLGLTAALVAVYLRPDLLTTDSADSAAGAMLRP